MDISAIAAEVPEAAIGAGTVLQPRQFDDVRRAAARFAVSPGCTPTLVTAARAAGLPFLPGIQTVSRDAIAAADWVRIERLAAAAAELKRL